MKTMLGLMVLLLFLGCAATTDNTFNSTLWIQTASEYKAHALQTYRAARSNIQEAINDKQWTAALEQSDDYSDLPPAVILDVDETVLDNSVYQANLIKNSEVFTPANWDYWVSLKRASSVAGAVDFINEIQRLGVHVFFVTNRECRKRMSGKAACPQETETIENLKKVGIEVAHNDNVLLKYEIKDWSSEKKTRRAFIAERYRIIMLFGDDLGDFLPHVKYKITPTERDELVYKHRQKWGKMWFVLSNPIYGSWDRVLEEPKDQYLKGY
jgi:acid phosphatase